MSDKKNGKEMVKQVRKSAGEASARVVEKTRQAVQTLPEKVSKMSKPQKALAVGAAAAAATAVGVVAARRRRKNRGKQVFLLEPHDDSWKIVKQGEKKPQAVFETKTEALAAARELAREKVPSELVIFNRDGAEVDRHSYDAS